MDNYKKYKAKIEQSNGPKITYEDLDEDDFGDDDDSNDEYNQKKNKNARKGSNKRKISNSFEETDAKRTKTESVGSEECLYFPIEESPNIFEFYPEENIIIDNITSEDMVKYQETLEIETLKECLKREVLGIQKINNYECNYNSYDDGYSSLNSSPELCEKLEFDDSILGEYKNINWDTLYNNQILIDC